MFGFGDILGGGGGSLQVSTSAESKILGDKGFNFGGDVNINKSNNLLMWLALGAILWITIKK